MRYSAQPSSKDTLELIEEKMTNEAFLQLALEKLRSSKLACNCIILLVGGSDYRSLSVRRAQAVLRFDRRHSYWSHAALLMEAHPGQLQDGWGLEVSMHPREDFPQLPENNGVTRFQLKRYIPRKNHPNLCLVGLRLESEKWSAVKSRALDPNRDRMRYPLWDLLGPWAHFTYAPDAFKNPLLDGIAHPSAAFVQYVLEPAGIDLSPGASGNHDAPELFWATMKHWSTQIEEAQEIGMHAVAMVRDKVGSIPAAAALGAPG